jgi:Tfp pilus assembly protein PilN
MSALRWLSALLLALAVVAGAALLLQRQATAQLRDEIALLRDENRELARLRAENKRLAAVLPVATELEQLRADRAAVVRLRGEIEKLKARTDEMARAPDGR